MKILTASLIIIFLIIALPYLYRILELETISKSNTDFGLPKRGTRLTVIRRKILRNIMTFIH